MIELTDQKKPIQESSKDKELSNYFGQGKKSLPLESNQVEYSYREQKQDGLTQIKEIEQSENALEVGD